MEPTQVTQLGTRRDSPIGIRTGLAFGTVVGLVGSIQAYLTAHYWADRQAELDMERVQYPNLPDLGKDLLWKEALFLVGTGILALLFGLLLCVLAAFVVARRSGRPAPGVRAALITGVIGWAIYLGGCQGVITPSYPAIHWNLPLDPRIPLLLVVLVVGMLFPTGIASWVAAISGAAVAAEARYQAMFHHRG